MKMKLLVDGEIVDDGQKVNENDVCPSDIKAFLAECRDNEPLEVEITSPGGSVFAGIQIANMLARHGNVTTHAVGLVASIATVILMAGERVAVDENAFLCLHNPWTIAQGNANDLAKEIQQLNQCKEAMMGFYRKHMNVTDEELSKILDEETWYLGKEFAEISDCEVLACDAPLKIAAKVLERFNNIPKGLMMSEEVKKEEEEVKEEVEETTAEVVEETTEEVKEEEETTEGTEAEDEPSIEELEKTIEEQKKTIEELEAKCKELEDKCNETDVDKRVSGMQAKMQTKLNAQEKDFKAMIEAKDMELSAFKAQISAMTEKLDAATKDMENYRSSISALKSEVEEKSMALDTLNAAVNTPNIVESKDAWKKLHGKEFFDYVKTHNLS